MTDTGDALTVEERCERVRMALAEAGYPDTQVRIEPTRFGHGEGRGVFLGGIMPPVDVRWRVHVITGSPETACLACFRWERSILGEFRYAVCTERGQGTDDCGGDRL